MKTAIGTLLLIWLVLAALPLGAAPADPARHAWMKGYEAMTQAEQEEKDHADLAALRHYEQALEIFVKVNHDYPEWNVSILKYRIDYCQKKIADIKEQNAQNTAFLSREDLIAQLASANTDLQTVREQAGLLANQLREAKDALQLARAEAAAQTANEENLRILRNDREVLTAQVQKLTEQLAAAQETIRKNAESAQNRQQLDDLRKQLATATSQLEQTSRLLEQTAAARDMLLQQNQRESQWHTIASEQLDALREQLASANQRADVATRQLEELRQNLRMQGSTPDALAAIADEQATPEQLRAKLRARETELQNAQMELLNVKRQLLQAEETAASNLQELTELRRRTAATNQAMADKLSNAETLQSENNRLTGKLAELQGTVDSQRELLAKLEATAARSEQRAGQAEAKAQALQEQLDAALGAADGLGLNAEDDASALQRSQAKIAILTRQGEQTAQALQAAQATIQDLKSQLEKLVAGNSEEAIQAAGKVWMEQLRETREQLEEATRRQHELEAALIKRENEKNALAEALRESEKGDGGGQQPSAEASVAVIQTTPDHPAALLSRQDAIILRAYLRQGVDAERAGKPESAQWNYEQALAIQPENPTALKRLGILAYQRHDFQEAAQKLADAFRLSPDDHDILLALGFTMLQLNQPQWALAYLSRAIALKPQDFQTAKLFGNALASIHWREAATAQLERALQLQPDDAETAMTLAMLQLTTASETLLAAQKNPTHQEALERLAATQRKKALEWYRQAVQNGAQPDPKLEANLQK